MLSVGATLADGRLAIRRRLGEGGMGVVYEAFDALRKARVALKTLTRIDASGVYRLKNEFRALAEVTHPNLVQLHELFSDGETWWFTMELVEGERLDRWLRPRPSNGDGSGVLDEARLRAALPQLVQAIGAIHAAGKLHRDLKPSNVLVTEDGRVVVLDFGLAIDPELGGVGQTVADDSVSGTPAYMAPEQAAGHAASAASDFYALGVMLFEGLTGRLPFEGRAGELLAAKQTAEAPAPSALTPGVPADLARLCTRLLARDESARPDERALRVELGLTESTLDSSARLRASGAPRAARAPGPDEAMPELLGRDAELTALREAFAATLAGHSVVVYVRGESGMGKSALCAAFLAELRAQGRATVLSGRCYERENVPFKGFDSLVDDLSRHLRRLPREEAIAILPREVFALSRLFPVLDRVEVVASAPQKEIVDPQELRRRAFSAFGELMARTRDRGPLCVHLDDVQWLDADAVLFLRALMVHPDPVPALLLLSHRSEGAEQNTALLRVRDAAEGNSRLQQRTLAVGPLSEEAGRALASRLLSASTSSPAQAAQIARESGGSPFFAGELARYVTRHGSSETALGQLSLDAALSDHVATLAPAARRLLEHSALAGRPLPADLLLEASGASHAELDALRGSHLLRSSSLEGSPLVECYHDKVREAVVGALSELQRIACSATLAATLEPHPGIDPELLATCFEGAGQRAQAASYAAVAADAAIKGTAFLHAASLYEKALALGAWDEAREHALHIAHADALAYAGRGKQAAEVYLRAADGAPDEQGIELRRRAAEQLLTTGHVAEGTALFHELFRVLGMTLPATTGSALRRLVISQLRLRIRGLRFELRAPDAVARRELLTLQTFRSACDGLASNAPLVAASVADAYLLTAFSAGVPEHLAHALAFQAYFTSFATPNADSRITALQDLAMELACTPGDQALIGRVEVLTGNSYINRGLWTKGREHEARAHTILGKVHGATWDLDVVQVYDQVAAFQRGDFRDIASTTPTAIEHGFGRERAWVGVLLSGQFGTPAWLCADDAAGYERILKAARARWQPQPEAQWPDFFLGLGEVALALYRGESARASAAIERSWPWLARSLVVRAQMPHSFGLYWRATSAVAALRASASSAPALASARDSRRKLARLDLAYAPAYRDVIDAGLALHARDEARAASLLRAAIKGFDASDMSMYAAATRRRLGRLLAGDEGAALLAEGDAAMRAQRVVNLEAMTEMLCAGC